MHERVNLQPKIHIFRENLLKPYFSSNSRPENLKFEEKLDFEDPV